MIHTAVQPYLFFGGRCQEAVEFYRDALGAEVEMMMFYKDSPDASTPEHIPPGFENKVMHTSFRIGQTSVMASDGCEEGSGFKGFALSIGVNTPDEVDKIFVALSEGGKVSLQPEKTFWSPRFGMLTDRFGIDWMVGVVQKQ